MKVPHISFTLGGHVTINGNFFDLQPKTETFKKVYPPVTIQSVLSMFTVVNQRTGAQCVRWLSHHPPVSPPGPLPGQLQPHVSVDGWWRILWRDEHGGSEQTSGQADLQTLPELPGPDREERGLSAVRYDVITHDEIDDVITHDNDDALCPQYDLCQVQPRFLLALSETMETDTQRLLQLLRHGWSKHVTWSQSVHESSNQRLESWIWFKIIKLINKYV